MTLAVVTFGLVIVAIPLVAAMIVGVCREFPSEEKAANEKRRLGDFYPGPDPRR
jgi:hypothetical protein